MTSTLRRRYDILTRTTPTVESEGWRLLGYYHLYRLALAAIFFTLATAELVLDLPARHSLLFATDALAIAVAALIGLVGLRLRWPQLYLQGHAAFLSDIGLLGILLFTRSDLLAILAVPLIIAVSGSATLFPRRVALAYAALCSLLVLFKQTLDVLAQRSDISDYLVSSIVGLACFSFALAVSYASSRARQSLLLVERQQADLSNLDRVNRIVAENLDIGVVTLDNTDQIRFANSIAENQLGLEKGAESLPRLLEILLRQAPKENDKSRIPFEFNDRQLSIRAVPLDSGTLLLIDDETLTNRRTQQLRFASLGRMAGEMAHEIRNPLSAVQQAAQLLEPASGGDEQDRQLIEIIRRNAARIDDIVESVQNLNRAHTPRIVTAPLRHALRQVIEQLEHTVESELKIDLAGKEVKVAFDPTQLEQVVVNLCQNALQHGKQAGARTKITLLTGVNGESRPFLDILDSGPGVRAEQLDQLFEPFASSDPQSSGLGLYISRRLCELNDARLEYLNDEDSHRFRVTFSGREKSNAQSAA